MPLLPPMPLPAKLGTGDKMYHLSDAGSLAGDISAIVSLASHKLPGCRIQGAADLQGLLHPAPHVPVRAAAAAGSTCTVCTGGERAPESGDYTRPGAAAGGGGARLSADTAGDVTALTVTRASI